MGEKREKWVIALQEYGIKVKPAKIVRGQGFCKLITGASNISVDEVLGNTIKIFEVCLTDNESQYSNLNFYLKNGYAPPKLNYKSKRALRLKSNQYELIYGVLFRKKMIQFH